jgi:serralysin
MSLKPGLMRVGLVVSCVIAATSVAGPAEAAGKGRASAGTSKVSFRAADNARNKVVITRSGRTVTIDDRVAITPGKGCKQVKGDKTKVRCRTAKPLTLFVVDLYDRDDSVVNNTDVTMHARGGRGSDTLVGGSRADDLNGDKGCEPPGNDKIYGRAGNDRITPGDGADYVNAGDGNDHVSGDGQCATPGRWGNDVIHGGNGNDALFGDNGNDRLYGGNGNDYLAGGYSADRLEGGAGNDELQGDDDGSRVAADILLGGLGRDLVDYGSYTKPLTVDLDGASRDDGLPGEHDTVGSDVEDVFGGFGNDRLIGNAAANTLDGFLGNDVILGREGNDRLEGGDGSNELYGEAGNDTLLTWTSINLLDGGPDTDLCRATPTATLISCENQ